MNVPIGPRLGMVATAAVAMMLLAVSPANATAGSAFAAGTGTYTPGLLPSSQSPQDLTFGVTGYVVTDTDQGTLTCNWSGHDTIGTIAQGAGSLTGACETPMGGSTATATYTRTAGVMLLSGSWAGTLSGNFTATCLLVPTNLSVLGVSVTSYAIACQFDATPAGVARANTTG